MIDAATDAQLLDALQFQMDCGVDEVMAEAPINRFEIAKEAPKLKFSTESNIQPVTKIPEVIPEEAAAEVAQKLAQKSSDREALLSAINTFDLCAFKQGARNTVFSDGSPKARVMIIGEAPGRDEDREGRPFVGQAGQLLDKMFAAIGLSRQSETPATAIYITNVMPWRPPQNRTPSEDEIAMMLPFLKRHIELIEPEFLVVMGNTACQAVLGMSGITKLRGNWQEAFGKPVLPMFHPAFLLRDPLRKKEAWEDLKDLRDRLGGQQV